MPPTCLKPALQSGTVRCIGSTTYKEYRQHFEKDRALVRRFQKIDIKEPTIEDSIEILKGLKPYFEEYHKLKYTNEAMKAAVELSAKYIHDRKLPDKAIDVIDETGASQMLVPEAKRKKKIGVKEVEATVATMARIPPKTITKSDAEVLSNINKDLKRLVFGQDKAIEALASSIKLSRAGLREPEKPIGCYLFSGPTGVGKTEVAKQLAALMGVELLRFDMSEYMEKHTVSRLIGAPPGYVGFDQGGLLTDGIDQHPHSVLLLDEIEKAHPDLFNILLQVMDHGKLTDHNGKSVDFRNVVLIMTTNAGALRPRQGADGLRPLQARGRRHGSHQPHVHAGVPQPSRRGHHVRRPAARDHHEGGGEVRVPARGAAGRPRRHHRAVRRRRRSGWPRPATTRSSAPGRSARVIQEHIKKPLADELLFGKLLHGGTVRVLVEGEGEERKLAFEYIPAEPKPKKAKGEGDEDDEARRRTRTRRRRWSRPTPRKALPGPRDKKDRPKSSGTVPSVPRRKDD